MDEFEGPARRQGGFPPILVALFLGALCGGGLGMQGRDLQSVSADLQRVLGAPALGGVPTPAPEWTPRQDPAQLRAELERSLTEAWPADRMAVAPAVKVHYTVAARGAVLGAR